MSRILSINFRLLSLAGNGRLWAFPRLIEPFPPVFLTTNASDSKRNAANRWITHLDTEGNATAG
jgi:hypothetical protein